MQNDNEREFMQSVSRALGRPPETADLDLKAFRNRFPSHLTDSSLTGEEKSGDDKQRRKSGIQEDRAEAICGRLERLKQKGSPMNLFVDRVPDPAAAAMAIRELVADHEPEWGTDKQVAVWAHPLLDALDLAQVLAPLKIPVIRTAMADPASLQKKRRLFNRIVGACIGVTSADYLVAETGTLVSRTRPHQPRMTSLVPSIHVAVVDINQVVADFHALYARLEQEQLDDPVALTRNLTLITGPSRTGDIELVMVNGAHGPREVHLLIVTGNDYPSL